MFTLDSPEDALPLLAYKIAPRQFDISYRFSNISLRDQIVRAQMLVRTLSDTGLVDVRANEPKENFKLLICGAGAAGLAAAKEAHARNISFVLVEKEEAVPGGVLRSKATRYVSTAMYEWPHPNHSQHNYPLSAPLLLGTNLCSPLALALSFDEPVLINAFGNKMGSALKPDIEAWTKNFADLQAGSIPVKRSLLATRVELSEQSKQDLRRMLDGKVSIHGVPLRDASLPEIRLIASQGELSQDTFRFEYVIYAVGFAKETVEYAKKKKPYRGFEQTPFWEPDRVFETNLGFTAPPDVGILGSGDGALQDALKCLVNPSFQHPLDIWNGLLDCEQKTRRRLRHSPHVREALAKVAAADTYTTNGAIWSHQTSVFESLDEAFDEIIDDLVKREGLKLQHAVDSISREDIKQLTIVTERGYFSKAYALNRFLVALFRKLLATSTKANTVKFEIASGRVVDFTKVGTNSRGACVKIEQTSHAVRTERFDLVIIRGGLEKNDSPSQLVGLTGMDTGRIELGRIPPPIRPIGTL